MTGRAGKDVVRLMRMLRCFIGTYGKSAVALLEQAARQWFGSESARAAFVAACQRDHALLEAWEIVEMAGPDAAYLLPLLVRRYLYKLSVDEYA